MSRLREMQTMDDVERAIELGRLFWEQGPYVDTGYGAYIDADIRRTFISMIDTPGQVVFMTDDAMIGGLLSPLIFNSLELIAHEAFWFSRKGSRDGQRVRKAFENWAFGCGASEVLMTCLADSHEKRMRNFLDKRQGYRALEVSLRKRAPWLSQPEPPY